MADAGSQEQKETCMQKCCNLGYFMTAHGFFKCLELLVVTLGLIFMASVSAINADAIKFFIFLTTAIMILLIIHIFLNVMNVYHRLPLLIIANLTQMICCALAALLLLIGSAIPLSKYSDWRVHAASILGLIAMGLFILETLYHLIQHKRGAGPQREEQSKPVSGAEAQEPTY